MPPTTDNTRSPPPGDRVDPPGFAAALRFWLLLGWISFGGPAGQIAIMHAELVEKRRWIDEERFLHALNYCMLLPGPEAQQLAIYIGWILHRRVGGLVAGWLFVLPGFVTILALSVVYATLSHVPIVGAVFFGLKAAVTAIVPLALADVAAALFTNIRMVRRIAEIYGGRSGALGSWRLLKAVMTHLVATGAVAVGDDLIHSVAGGGLLSKLSRRFGEGVINGALTARVGIAAMEVCRPLPFAALPRPKVSNLISRGLQGLFGRGQLGQNEPDKALNS